MSAKVYIKKTTYISQLPPASWPILSIVPRIRGIWINGRSVAVAIYLEEKHV